MFAIAPDIVERLLAGRQPKTMTLLWLKERPLPADWQAQREMIAQLMR